MPTEDDLLAAHRGLVCFLARRYAGHDGEVEDLEQEGSLALVLAARSYRPEIHGGKLATYLGHSIRNAMIDHLRRESRRPRTIDDAELRAIPMNVPTDDGDFWEAFSAALDCLGPIERAVFAGWVGGRRISELMRLHNVRRQVAYRALSRALTILAAKTTGEPPPRRIAINRRTLRAISA